MDLLTLLVVLFILAFPTWEIIQYARRKLREPQEQAALNFAKYMGCLPVEDALSVLRFGTGDYDKQLRAAMVLGGATGEEAQAAVPLLIRCLSDRDTRMRAIAAVSLGKIGDASAIEPLRGIADSRPDADELAWYKSAVFQREFHEAHARRSGAQLTGAPGIADPEAGHAQVREAVAAALQAIAARSGRR